MARRTSFISDHGYRNDTSKSWRHQGFRQHEMAQEQRSGGSLIDPGTEVEYTSKKGYTATYSVIWATRKAGKVVVLLKSAQGYQFWVRNRDVRLVTPWKVA